MVRYLKSFIQDRAICQRCCFRVNIATEVEKYKQRFPRSKPILVIDFLMCLSLLIDDKWELFTGGRHVKSTNRAEEFCQRLKGFGLELVFFLEGPIKQQKIMKYLANSNEKYKTQQVFFEKIRNEQDFSFHFRSHKLSSYMNNFQRVAQKYGRIKMAMRNECDVDLACYATEIKAMAVFTSDTDFLIMPGDWAIWTLNKFRMNDMSTLAWHKKNLREKLGLTQNQMPIFSTLSGNDFILFDYVQHINVLFNSDGVLQERLAEFIRRNFPHGVPMRKDDFQKLVDIVYNKGKNGFDAKDAKEKVSCSLDFYNYKSRQISPDTEDWLHKHIEATNMTIVYRIYKDFPLTINQSWIDMSLSEFRPFCELVLPIFRRQIGIVLYGERDKNPRRVFYFKPSHEEPFQPKSFTPVYPNFEIPDINEIVDCGFDSFTLSIGEKCKILSWLISPSKKVVGAEVIEEMLDSPFMVPTLVLNYLIGEQQITTDEADVFLLALHSSKAMPFDKMNSVKPPSIIKPRPFWISFVYNRLVEMFENCLVVVGLSKYTSCTYYDGFIFHKMYSNYPEIEYEKRTDILEPVSKYRIYMT